MSCDPGSVLKSTGSGWACGADLDTVTSYTAGAGLALSSNDFRIAAAGVTNAMLQNPSVTVTTCPGITVDRLALREEVHDRTRRLWEAGDARMRNAGVAERFAIEAALTQRGLLAQVRGGWC